MKKYVSMDKRSKKARKEYYSSLRQTWGGLNPVTRTVPNGKAYNRKKDKQEWKNYKTTSSMTKCIFSRRIVLRDNTLREDFYERENVSDTGVG